MYCLNPPVPKLCTAVKQKKAYATKKIPGSSRYGAGGNTGLFFGDQQFMDGVQLILDFSKNVDPGGGLLQLAPGPFESHFFFVQEMLDAPDDHKISIGV